MGARRQRTELKFAMMSAPRHGERILGSRNGVVVPRHPVVVLMPSDEDCESTWNAALELVDDAVWQVYHGDREVAWWPVVSGARSEKAGLEALPEVSREALTTNLVALRGPALTAKYRRLVDRRMDQIHDLYLHVRSWTGQAPSLVGSEATRHTLICEGVEDFASVLHYPAMNSDTSALIAFLQRELGEKRVRFPKTSAASLFFTSAQGQQRLSRAAHAWARAHSASPLCIVADADAQLDDIETNSVCNIDQVLRELCKPMAQGLCLLADPATAKTLVHLVRALSADVGHLSTLFCNPESCHAVFDICRSGDDDLAQDGSKSQQAIVTSAVQLLHYLGWDEAASQLATYS